MTKFSTLQKRVLLGGLALAVLLLITWRMIVHKPADAASRNAPPAIAVDTAAVSHSDVPIYLEGLGTVQAFYTVTVTARVDGEIQKIGFTEGQTVHKGDLLAQIDPRPNQAAYEQAVATKAKDAAQLANSKRDLDRYILAGLEAKGSRIRTPCAPPHSTRRRCPSRSGRLRSNRWSRRFLQGRPDCGNLRR